MPQVVGTQSKDVLVDDVYLQNPIPTREFLSQRIVSSRGAFPIIMMEPRGKSGFKVIKIQKKRAPPGPIILKDYYSLLGNVYRSLVFS